MAGFGLCAFGSAPFGLGTPATASEAPTGAFGSRFINATTRDYEVDETTGQLKQMPPVRQRVLLAVLTVLDSSAVRGFGIRMPGRMGDTFEAETRSAVNSALRHLTEIEKAIRVDAIQVERGLGGRARVTISWTDLLSGRRDRLTVS